MIEQREFFREEEIITTEQIEIITGLDSQGAEREHTHVLMELNTGSDEMLLDDYCQQKGLDSEEVFYTLNPPEIKWIIEDENEDLEFRKEWGLLIEQE